MSTRRSVREEHMGDPRRRVSPTTTSSWGLVRSFTDFLGGPLGIFARRGTQPFFTPLRIILACAIAFLSLGFLAKANCIQSSFIDGVAVLNWDANRQFTSACYNDIVPLYRGRGLNDPGSPFTKTWLDGDTQRYLEYPVLVVLFQWLMSALTRFLYPLISLLPFAISEVSVYFSVTAFVLALLWLVVVRLVAEMTVNRIWDTLLVACSPLIVVHAFTNWDILSIVPAVAALWFFSRRHAVGTGICIGIGVSVKLWPLFLLGAFFVLAVRSRRFKPFFRLVAAAVVTWLMINLPVILLYPESWGEFWRFNTTRTRELTTIYAVMERELGITEIFGRGDDGIPYFLNNLSLGLFVVDCIAIALLGIMVKRTPRVAELCFLIVAAFLLVNKVWSPQYSLWLVVFAVLATPRWRLLASWMLVDALLWLVVCWHFLGDKIGAPDWLLDLMIIGRDGFIIAICVVIIRQMLAKTPDPVLNDNDGRDPLLSAAPPSTQPSSL